MAMQIENQAQRGDVQMGGTAQCFFKASGCGSRRSRDLHGLRKKDFWQPC